MTILVENLCKQINHQLILNHIHLEIQTGRLVALIGPSGSGKSTLLRTIAGFEKPTEGYIWLNGQNTEYLSIQERQIGFVFQEYALFPHLTVFENIAFGLNIHHLSFSNIESRIQDLLQLIQLEDKKEFYPFQLSGGQQQRVAFARAISIEPKVLLLDEPFSALDIKVRRELRKWLYTLHQEMPLTTLLVTHDQHEAFEMADEIILFRQGQIEQFGTAQEFREYPCTQFVANFLLF